MSKDNLSWWQICKSVGAAFFGVQSSTNHKQDFAKGKPIQFIIIGLIGAIIFVGALIFAVNLVLLK
ncbi:DUF2970 domain-containing protein [Thalassotalea sp. M1531]|uniref:DUF2970 domain-containing protein n=1 Tax=Thalassotalea algicola TaxID=2716224 RepID=A0A7Y0Q659_9GAMM|nr:DUF2970 domain-containing protein [Thalassotalea algicola]NMP30467.1 DUF2970 domain-containing protein [Thalassotalea algicola]